MAGCFPSAPVDPVAPAAASTDVQNPRDRPVSLIQFMGCMMLISLLLVVPIIALRYYISIEFRNMIPLAEFRVDSVSFSPPNNISAPAAAEWNVQVSVWNAANRPVYFRDVQLSVWYNNGTKLLSAVRVENFSQSPKAWAKLRAHAKARLGNSVANAINDSVARDGLIDDFGLRVWANATYPFGFVFARNYYLRAYDYFCRNLKLGFSPTKSPEWTMVGGPRLCSETIDIY